MAAGIRSTCTKDTCIGSTYAVGTWIGCAGVGGACIRSICAKSASLGGVKSRVLVGLGVTLAGPGVNDYCL